MLFLSADNLFPFAFNPENINSREIAFQDEESLTINFDMNVEETPECAAVAVIFDVPKSFEELRFKIQTEGDPLKITAELKTIRLGTLEKFRAQKVANDGLIDFFDIEEKVKEIVFCCWRNDNKGKKGTIIIKHNA